jgi:fructoselysine-6-P-deglycase FrlB-like protein
VVLTRLLKHLKKRLPLMPPKLIDLQDVLAQPDVLKQILHRLPRQFQLPIHLLRPWVFVAEGSSYNAVQWHIKPLIQAHPRQRAILFYPWELEASLSEWQNTHDGLPFVVAVSQSGKTASLLRCIQKTARTWGHLGGILLTNAEAQDLDVTAWQGLVPHYLQVGQESAIAATKTFLATTFTLLAMVKPKHFEATLLKLIPELQRVLEALPQNPQWDALIEQFTSTMNLPITVIGAESVMPVLNEVHLKLTETLSRPVLTYHHEGFKHGPRSILHRKQTAWPLLVYACPRLHTTDFYADALLHLQHVDASHSPRLAHVWVRNASSPPVPEALLALGNGLEFVVESTLPDDVLLLVLIQRIAVSVVEQLGLEADGLTKYVAESPQ